MITEDYVSFETAKLLKEKGFDETNCNTCYKNNGNFCNNRKSMSGVDSMICYQAPTLQMAIKWLREIKKIFITVGCCDYPSLHKTTWIPEICTHDTIFQEPVDEYDTYEQACETAIKYCLEKLI